MNCEWFVHVLSKKLNSAVFQVEEVHRQGWQPDGLCGPQKLIRSVALESDNKNRLRFNQPREQENFTRQNDQPEAVSAGF